MISGIFYLTSRLLVSPKATRAPQKIQSGGVWKNSIRNPEAQQATGPASDPNGHLLNMLSEIVRDYQRWTDEEQPKHSAVLSKKICHRRRAVLSSQQAYLGSREPPFPPLPLPWPDGDIWLSTGEEEILFIKP